MRRVVFLLAAVLGCAPLNLAPQPAAPAGGPALLIADPPHSAWVVKDKPFPLSGVQQVRPGGEGQAIALQWADGPDGPWTLCTLVGAPDPGPIECSAWCYTTQGTEFELEAVTVHELRWVRAAVFADQGATGSPIDSSGPIRWRLRAGAPGGDSSLVR